MFCRDNIPRGLRLNDILSVLYKRGLSTGEKRKTV